MEEKQTTLSFKIHLPINGVDGQHSIASDVRVSVLQTLSDGWHEWLHQLWLFQLAQESQSGATDKLVGVLKIL